LGPDDGYAGAAYERASVEATEGKVPLAMGNKFAKIVVEGVVLVDNVLARRNDPGRAERKEEKNEGWTKTHRR